jgi:adenylyltransferase/sulfurtransferase
MDNPGLSNQELRRYKRQILLPEFGETGQQKLRNAKVILIGAGGIGTAALQYLSAAGIGEIGICDNSIIEESDFQNQVIFNSIDLGKHKTIVAKTNLEGANNFSKFSIYNIFISSQNAENICCDFNLIIDTSNDRNVSLVLDELSLRLKIPLIHVCRNKNKYNIAVFNFNGGVSFREYIAHESTNASGSWDPDSYIPFGACDGIAGSIMALEAFKIISGTGEVLSNRILSIDPFNLKFEFIKI